MENYGYLISTSTTAYIFSIHFQCKTNQFLTKKHHILADQRDKGNNKVQVNS